MDIASTMSVNSNKGEHVKGMTGAGTRALLSFLLKNEFDFQLEQQFIKPLAVYDGRPYDGLDVPTILVYCQLLYGNPMVPRLKQRTLG